MSKQLTEIEEMMVMDTQDIDYKTYGEKIGSILRKKTPSLKMKALDINCQEHENAKKLLDAINALWDKAQNELGYTIRINREGIINVSREEELIFQGQLDNE